MNCSLVTNDFPNHPTSSTYAHPLEPIEVSKTLDDPQASIYKPNVNNDEEGTSVLTLECSGTIKPSTISTSPHDTIKMESLETTGRRAHGVGGVVEQRATATTTPVPVVAWTPLTPPQSAMQ